MQLVLFSLLVLSIGARAAAADVPRPPALSRATYNFNPDWRVFVGDPTDAAAPAFDDAAWKSVTLPYAWNEDSAFKEPIDRMPTGIAWYRKTFRVPANAAGRKIFIEFEGARQAAEVWVNGRHLGRHENGITAFGFDISDGVKPAPQDNVIAVRTDNSYTYAEKATGTAFQWNQTSFNVSYGGLTKNVRLHVSDKLYQTLPLHSTLGTIGTYVYAHDFDIPARAANLHVESEVRNENRQPRTFVLEVELRDADGKVVTTFHGKPQTLAAGATGIATAAKRVTGLNFWSWGYGYLYDVKSTLVVQDRPVDDVTTRTGFRKTGFAHGMLMLNGRATHLKGTRREPGRIMLTARSGTLKPDSVEFTSQPFVATAGLSNSQPADDLPSYLGRGPTPAGASFKPSRIAVPVSRVVATDGADAARAHDDNEVTIWAGKEPITFELARPARLTGITAKFAGFRARSYPIRITIDGQEVFRGATPRSLGYVALPLKAVTGRVVTVQVLGADEAKEAFGNIRELEDQGNATTGEESVGPGELGIVEIEFNEPAPSAET